MARVSLLFAFGLSREGKKKKKKKKKNVKKLGIPDM